MKEVFKSDNKPCTLVLNVATRKAESICVIVSDFNNPDTMYTNRHMTVNGEQNFHIRMPQTPVYCQFQVFNRSNGDLRAGRDTSFALLDRKVIPLNSKLPIKEWKNPVVKSFVKLAQEFSERASKLSAGGSVYKSDDGNFTIVYYNDIQDTDANGRIRILKTPSRVSDTTGIIEVSKNRFKTFTVPMRMAILLHEFSHFYMNKNMRDEIEADMNALLIYLGLGYPRVEAMIAFTKVFANSEVNKPQADNNSQLNKDRTNKIMEFIGNFEKQPFMINYV